MAQIDPRVDAYIDNAAEFARPILRHLRALVHKGCPQVEESIKWGSPHFGHHGMMCGMSAFKAHCAFGFWNRALKLPDNPEAMGQFGCLRTLADLPKDAVILRYVKEAARLNEAGIKERPAARRPRPVLPEPPELTAALKQKMHAAARAAFDALSPSHKREYYEWIGEAKGAETRARRVATTIEWVSTGKSRNWQYAQAKPRPAGSGSGVASGAAATAAGAAVAPKAGSKAPAPHGTASSRRIYGKVVKARKDG